MSTFLVELYAPRADSQEIASDAAHRLAREHDGIRHVRTLLVGEDETCFLVFEAPSRQALVAAAARAGLAEVRITETTEDDADPSASNDAPAHLP